MRVLRCGAASAVFAGITLTLTGTAVAAGPSGTAPPGGPCAVSRTGSAADVLDRAVACSGQAARPQAPPRNAEGVEAAVRTAVGAQKKVCGPPYVHGDPRLGPRYLPRTGYFGYLLRGYDRYGRLTPSQFLYQYWDLTKLPKPGWRYPPDDGFVHQLKDINSRPLRFKVRLDVGQYIDRFGLESGKFLSPGGASFGSRALPPDNLNTNPEDPKHLCNYHLYSVTRKFSVDAGPAQPAFQQPGQGLQYVLVSRYVKKAPNPLSAKWLADHGYLRRIN